MKVWVVTVTEDNSDCGCCDRTSFRVDSVHGTKTAADVRVSELSTTGRWNTWADWEEMEVSE